MPCSFPKGITKFPFFRTNKNHFQTEPGFDFVELHSDNFMLCPSSFLHPVMLSGKLNDTSGVGDTVYLGPRATVRFVSDGSNVDTGFELLIEAVPEGKEGYLAHLEKKA